LAGTVTGDRKFEASDVRARSNKTLQQLEAIKDELAQFRQLAAESAMSVTQLATAWVLSHAPVSTALCGCKSIEQVAEISGASDAGLRPSVKAKLDELSLAATNKFDRVQ
jgi:aryl-alcohol dehydrogenase-like predicted oxidoreductase